MSEYKLIQASAHDTGLPAKSVHCAITSPPYYGLRAYAGEQLISWPEVTYSPMPGMPCITIPAQRSALGLEQRLEDYIAHLILVLRETGRVLRDDGLFFVNLGDSYNSSPSNMQSGTVHRDGYNQGYEAIGRQKRETPGLKPKDLMLVPSRFALAAQADGWYVRSAMPWIKRNGMPESVTDRPAQTIESIFMLAKAEKYFWDGEAVKQDSRDWGKRDRTGQTAYTDGVMPTGQPHKGLRNGDFSETGRNLRASDPFFATWQGLYTDEQGDPLALIVNPRPYKHAHFATFPELLPETFIKAATSAYGTCPTCGAQWRRCVEKEKGDTEATERPKRTAGMESSTSTLSLSGNGSKEWAERGSKSITTGWAPGCTCPDASQVQPATVYDPFSGSGTTGKVALRLGRSYVGVDLSSEYLEDLAPARLSNVQMEIKLCENPFCFFGSTPLALHQSE